MAGVHDAEITKVLRQVPPRDAGFVAVECSIHKQKAVVTRSRSRLASLAGQQVLDALPVRIAQGIFSGNVQLSES